MADLSRLRVLIAASGTLVAGVGLWTISGVWGSGGDKATAVSVPISTALVTRTDVAERRLVKGTLGHAGTFDILSGAAGTVTWLPRAGHVVKRGQPAFEVDGAKVPLFYGHRPAWRELALGMTDGVDVEELESNLSELGFGRSITVDRHFSPATYWAVRRWQKAAHLPVTGTVPLGQVVFVRSAVRVSGLDVKVGATTRPGDLIGHGTGSVPDVAVELDPADVPNVKVGDAVIVSLPDGTIKDGAINDVSSVAVTNPGTSGAAATVVVPVTITLKGSVKGLLDQAQVQVGIISQRHKKVLAVPTVALLARPFGKYMVSVVNASARRDVEVQLGLFDETSGLTEISGAGLAEGDHVEVPDGSS